MKNRRTLTLTAVSALAVSAAVLPLSLAQAATGSPTASLVVAPAHGTPGTSLTGTITVASCDTPSVVVNGTYVDVNGDPATTPTVTAVAQDATTFTAALSVPADAARSDLSEEPLTFTASVTCATSSPSPSPSPSATPTATASPTPAATAAPAVRARAAAAPVSATASANVTVDALAEPVVTVTPSTVTVGKAFSFSITGCTGGLADLYTLDGADKDTSVPQGAVDQLSATSYRGTVTIPANATVGAGSLVVECAQAASSGADLELVAAAGSTITTSAAPPATPVIRTPHFTG